MQLPSWLRQTTSSRSTQPSTMQSCQIEDAAAQHDALQMLLHRKTRPGASTLSAGSTAASAAEISRNPSRGAALKAQTPPGACSEDCVAPTRAIADPSAVPIAPGTTVTCRRVRNERPSGRSR